MPNLFSGINLALRALLSHQMAIQVTEHNVANANTAGYRRQEAVLTAGATYARPGLSSGNLRNHLGGGVTVDRIRRFNLDFFDGRFRAETSEAKRWALQSEVLSQVELSLAETGSDGLTARLDAFWSGWQAVSSDPTNLALRSDLRERGVALAQAFNSRVKSLNALRQDQDLAIQQRVDEINSLAGQIARLNAEVVSVKAAGGEPNDNLDERDRLLTRLAELSGATSSEQENGEVLVSVGGHALVIGTQVMQLTTQADSTNENLREIIWTDGQDFKAARGELAGLLAARDEDIPRYLSALNELAFNLASKVNEKHVAGHGLNDSLGVNFFARFSVNPDDPLDPNNPNNSFDPAYDYALQLQVDARILADVSKIAAAPGTSTNAPGNGNLAGEIADLRTATLMKGTTFNGFYSDTVAGLGLDLKGAQTRAADRQLLADSLDGMAESVGGVSLDEEAANLVKSQRAYQAAARMMTALDEMLDTIINGLGVVGR